MRHAPTAWGGGLALSPALAAAADLGMGNDASGVLGWALLVLAGVALWRNIRQRRVLEAAAQDAQRAADAALAAEASHVARERFGKELLLALQGRETLADFGDILLMALCRRLEAQAAAWHCLDTSSGVYVLAASYAAAHSAGFRASYRPGEGLAGQAALACKRLVCRGQAADWMEIASGTQRSAPMTVVIAPVVSGTQAFGVVELALMRELDADDTALPLLDEVLPLVALSLDVLRNRLDGEAATAEREQRLQDSEAKLRAIFETANEGIWVIDAQARTIDLNAAMAQILGVAREPAIGRSIFEFVDAANEAVLREQMRRRQQGERSAYEIHWRQADGTLVPCLMNASPLFDGRGQRIGSFAMVTDLRAHRKLAEASALHAA